MKSKIEAITKESFKPYGQLITLPVESEPTISVPTVKFWKQQAWLSFEGDAEVGVLCVKKMPMEFTELENHFKSPTGLICMTGDWVIGVTTPGDATPKAADVQAFRVPKNQLVVLDAKCWHTAPYPIDQEESTMLVICEKNFLDDDTVYEALDQPGELVV